MNRILLIVLMLSATSIVAQSQQFSLDQCIKYALENHGSIKSSQLDVEFAQADIKEIAGQGLPQISAEGSFNYLYQIPTQILPDFLTPGVVGVNQGFFGLQPVREIPAGGLGSTAAQFGTQYDTKIGATASQLIFSGSYFVGLSVVKGYKELMISALNKTKVDVVEKVTKAYYNVLMMSERGEMINANIVLLDSLYNQTKAMYEAGFVERIEVDKVEVNLNNIKSEKSNFNKMTLLSYQLLKFQMGMAVQDSLTIIDNLDEFQIPILDGNVVSDAENRIEYKMLSSEESLYAMEKKLNQAAYLPSLVAFANHSYNLPTDTFKNTFSSDEKWYPTGIVGLKLSIPIFSGFMNKAKVQKSEINIQRAQNKLDMFKKGVNLEVSQSALSLKNSISDLETKKQTMKLAKNVFENVIKKNKLGTTSLFEITSANTEYRTAQTNYYEALYSVIISKIDLDKAKGELKF